MSWKIIRQLPAALISVLLILPAACAQEVQNAPNQATPEPGTIAVSTLSLREDTITFDGLARVSDGTILRTQLYQGFTTSSWWPADRDIKVSDGKWTISMPINPSWFVPGMTYTLEMWEKDNPMVRGNYRFDLDSVRPVYGGPPKTRFWPDWPWLRSIVNFFRNLFR